MRVGARVRLLCLSGQWLEELPTQEKEDVISMIGEVFEVDELMSTAIRGFESHGPTKKKGSAIHIQSR